MNATLKLLAPEGRLLEAHLAAFDKLEKQAGPGSPSWLRALRTSGISYFADLGFPTIAEEEWRFTNPAPLAGFPFLPSPAPPRQVIANLDLTGFDFPGLEGPRLVFVDGRWVPELSRLCPLPRGAVVGSLAQALRTQPQLLEGRLGRVARHEQEAFTALNTGFIEDGALVCLPAGAVLEYPVHLLHVTSWPDTVRQPRHLVLAGQHSRLCVIEDYVSLSEAGGLTNAVTEIFADEGAEVEHVRFQRESLASLHVATVEARQRDGSSILSHSISLGAHLARIQINLHLEGQGCDSVLNGLYFADGQQHVDHHTLADHASPHCTSHEFYHGILSGQAKGVFNGRIFVHPGAQKTNAKQTNRNLLLSSEAALHSKPQLQIFANDVKCTHGATVGQMDDDALFYLRSRGIGEQHARQMLVQAFAGAVLGRITPEPVRAGLERLLSARLEAIESAKPAQAPASPQPSPA